VTVFIKKLVNLSLAKFFSLVCELTRASAVCLVQEFVYMNFKCYILQVCLRHIYQINKSTINVLVRESLLKGKDQYS
jgi:hypothetical protein